jgi:ferredoxin
MSIAIGGRMDVQVDRNLCEANGRCVAVAPEVFVLDDDEILHITVPPEGIDPDRLARAVDSCPLTALSLDASGGTAPSP